MQKTYWCRIFILEYIQAKFCHTASKIQSKNMQTIVLSPAWSAYVWWVKKYWNLVWQEPKWSWWVTPAAHTAFKYCFCIYLAFLHFLSDNFNLRLTAPEVLFSHTTILRDVNGCNSTAIALPGGCYQLSLQLLFFP